MKKNFAGLSKFLQEQFPPLVGSITGDNYPPPPYAVMLSQVASFLWFAGMAFTFFGDKIFSMLGMPTPDWYAKVMENKFMVLAGLFLFNNVATNLTSTGAFEVYLNDELVFSKLQEGRMPNGQEILERMVAMGLQR